MNDIVMRLRHHRSEDCEKAADLIEDQAKRISDLEAALVLSQKIIDFNATALERLNNLLTREKTP